MDGTRPQQPLTDSQLDCELEAALRIEPTPEFLARVRMRIGAVPATSPWRLADVVSGFSRTLRLAVDPLWAVAIVGIVLAIVVPPWIRTERQVTGPAIADVALPSTGKTSLTVSPYWNREAVEPSPARAQVARSAVRRQTRLNETRSAEVLISRDEQRAFDALLIALAQNRLPVRVTDADEPDDELAIPAVEIQQLTIEPLQLTRLE